MISEKIKFFAIAAIIIELETVESTAYRFGWIQVCDSSLTRYMTSASVFPTIS